MRLNFERVKKGEKISLGDFLQGGGKGETRLLSLRKAKKRGLKKR